MRPRPRVPSRVLTSSKQTHPCSSGTPGEARRRPPSERGREPAVAKLERAHRIFSELGADPFVQTCSSELVPLRVTAVAESPAEQSAETPAAETALPGPARS